MNISPRSSHDLTRRQLTGAPQLEVFAKTILSCCLDHWELFNLARLCLNYDESTARYDRSDFLDPVDGLVFAGMNAFRDAWIEGNPIPVTRFHWYQAVAPHIGLLFHKNPDWPSQFKEAAFQRILMLPPPSMGDHDRICDGLVDYVMGIRYHLLEARCKGMDPATKHDAYQDVPRSIRIPGSEALVVSSAGIFDTMLMAPAAAFPFATGVSLFDTAYGNTAQRGDAWLAYGCPGGGKTILACQTLGFTAAMGKKVCFITTEVKPHTILLRACSAHQGISYSSLKGLVGIGNPAINPLGLTLQNWAAGVGSNFLIFNYSETPGSGFSERLMKILDKFEKNMGCPPEMVILDWVGKAIDEDFEDSWMKRELYSRVGVRMAELADELDGQTLTLAQAKPGTKNKINLTEFDTADCGSLSQPMEGVIGITSLVSAEETGTGSSEVHRAEQYWVIPKCREEMTLRVPVLRAFNLARFESPR